MKVLELLEQRIGTKTTLKISIDRITWDITEFELDKKVERSEEV